MMRIKRASIFLLTLLLAVSFSLPGAAEVPYAGYSYDEWGVAIPSTVGYQPSEVFYGDAALSTRFNTPEDFYIDADGFIYVLDTGNSRVLILDQQMKLIKIIDTFTLADGSPYSLFTPKGIHVQNGLLYIADYDNMCVIVSDLEGNVKLQIHKPEDPTFPQDSEFRPMRVLVDSQDRIYVLVLGVYQGAAVFNAKGEFVDFFGSNTVQPTIQVLMDQMWKRLLSKEQRSQISNYVPVQFTGFDITTTDFVYSCTGANISGLSELRRINPMGKNIWTGNSQGDYEVGWYKNKGYFSVFVDVAVTEDEFLFALDSTKGRVFLYDPEGNLVFIFGGKGSQKGTFIMPTAVETYGEKVFVLDSGKRSLTVFEPTEYGTMVNKALRLYVDGSYAASREIWESVLKMDGNLYTAYIGIGKALYYSGDYKESMRYFQLGNARANESKAFKEYRSVLLRSYFPYMMSGAALLIAALVLWRLLRRRRKKKGGSRRG